MSSASDWPQTVYPLIREKKGGDNLLSFGDPFMLTLVRNAFLKSYLNPTSCVRLENTGSHFKIQLYSSNCSVKPLSTPFLSLLIFQQFLLYCISTWMSAGDERDFQLVSPVFLETVVKVLYKWELQATDWKGLEGTKDVLLCFPLMALILSAWSLASLCSQPSLSGIIDHSCESYIDLYSLPRTLACYIWKALWNENDDDSRCRIIHVL